MANRLMTESNTVNRATNKASPIHWYILGAGAIGCLWAANLRRAGFTVTLLTRKKKASQLDRPTAQAHNTVTIKMGPQTITNTVDLLNIEEFLAQGKQPERLLITTKAQQTLPALTTIQRLITPSTLLLILQNGLAAKEVYRQFPDNRVIAGVTTDGAYLASELSVVHAGVGQTALGQYDGNDCHDLMAALPFNTLNIECCNDIEIRQWQKLAVNCAANALTAIYHCRNGELLDNAAALETMHGICNEVIAVTTALGFPQEYFAQCFELTLQTLRLTANNYSSMYKDVEHGRSTEIDFINGYLCKEARRLNICCEENEKIIAAINGITKT